MNLIDLSSMGFMLESGTPSTKGRSQENILCLIRTKKLNFSRVELSLVSDMRSHSTIFNMI
jgi:hypothetical protein